MDLNDLYHRHQVALFLSESAASLQARTAQAGLAINYAALIDAAKNGARDAR